MDDQITLRTKAVRQSLNGNSKTSIAQSLDKSRYWVSYWLGRYNPDDPVASTSWLKYSQGKCSG